MFQLRRRAEAHSRVHQRGKGRGQTRVGDNLTITAKRHPSGPDLTDAVRIPPFDYRDILWLSLILATAGWAFSQSYQKWLDPIIDVGRDLYIPGELLKGRKLYRDILYIYPPLAPYLLSFITWLFGSGLSVYTALGVIVSMVVTGTLYFVTRATVHAAAAGVISLLFVALNFTGPGFNFIFPYTYAATLGIAFFLLYIGFTIAYLFSGRKTHRYILAFTFALLAAWTKTDLTFAVTVTLFAIFITYKLPGRYFFYSLLITLASISLMQFFFRDSSIGHHWLRDNIFSSPLLSSQVARLFFIRVFGLEHLTDRLKEIVFGALLVITSIGLFWGIDRTTRYLSLYVRWWRVAALVIFFAATIFLFWELANVRFFRAWSLLQVVLIPVAIRKERHSPFCVLLLFSICASLRIYLNLEPERFGFTLILPAYLLMAYVLFRYLPERGIYSTETALLWIPLFLLIIIRGQMEQREYYSLKRFRVETAQGSFYDRFEGRAMIIQDFLRYVKNSRSSELVVMPEGLTLNYFSQTRNPLSFHTFTPPETARPQIEQRILEEMEKFRPELVAINNRTVQEFGFTAFGVDYNRRLIAYLQQNYVVLRIWESPSFRLTLLLRRDPGRGHETPP